MESLLKSMEVLHVVNGSSVSFKILNLILELYIVFYSVLGSPRGTWHENVLEGGFEEHAKLW